MTMRVRQQPLVSKMGLGTVFILELAAIYALIRLLSPVVERGFLVKSGDVYLIAWKVVGEDYKSKNFASLAEALHFAHHNLQLRETRISEPIDPVESVESVTIKGKYRIIWKRRDEVTFHRLTFRTPVDADYFAKAFREGRYSTSPFGHSISLRP